MIVRTPRIQPLHRLVLFAAAGLCLGLVAQAPAADGIDAAKLKGVHAATPAAAAEKQAIDLLRRGMKLLYGVDLPATKNAEGPTIILGRKAALAAGVITEEDLRKVSIGGYVLKTADGRIAIAGNTPACTYYGVRGFLQRLGVRLYDGAPVVATKPADAAIPALDVHDKPALIFRTFDSHPHGEWANAAAALKKDVSVKTDQWIDHSAGYLVPKDLYYDEHPDWYAMRKDGKRVAKDAFTYHRTPLCLSNAEMTKVATARALEWVQKQPDSTFFPITYGDTGLWCQCPACRKLDPAPGQYSARLLHWVNPIAKAIAAKHPDKIVVTFAYGGSDAPPANVPVADNVHICLAVPFAGLVFWDHSKDHPAMRSAVQRLAGWNKAAPGRVGVCEYHGGVYFPALVDSMPAKCRAYAKLGVNAVYFSYGRPKNLPGLWRFLFRELMWDPSQDAHALAREYVRFHYKPAAAAEAMVEYLDLCHQRYQQTLAAGDELDDRPYPHVITFYDKAFADRALDCLGRAGQTGEQKLFLLDWMAHPVSKTLTDDAAVLVRYRCERLAKLAGDSEKARAELAKQLRSIRRAAERAQKGAGAVIDAWMKEHGLTQPPAQAK